MTESEEIFCHSIRHKYQHLRCHRQNYTIPLHRHTHLIRPPPFPILLEANCQDLLRGWSRGRMIIYISLLHRKIGISPQRCPPRRSTIIIAGTNEGAGIHLFAGQLQSVVYHRTGNTYTNYCSCIERSCVFQHTLLCYLPLYRFISSQQACSSILRHTLL